MAQQLLARHGVVTREAVGAGIVPGGFGVIYPVLKAMEENGRVRRGYFVAGLGATQFALPGALDLLRSLRDAPEEPEVAVMAATDPANPYGATLKWPAPRSTRNAELPRDIPTSVNSAAPARMACGAARGPTRSVGATVILVNGALAAYLARGDRQLSPCCRRRSRSARRVARAVAHVLIERARTRRRHAARHVDRRDRRRAGGSVSDCALPHRGRIRVGGARHAGHLSALCGPRRDNPNRFPLPTTDPAAPNRLRRALVLGAGHVGFAVAFDLSQQQSCDVTVVDTSETRLARLAGLRHVTTTRVDANEVTALRALASAHDVVVGALPSVLGYRTLEALIGACPAIVDISFMPEDALALDAIARRAGTTVVVDCGVAPGLSHMMVGDAVRRVDECRSVKILVGGLPAHRGGLFDYKAGFSPYDVIEEYVRPARIVEDFEVIAREGLSGLETVEVAGVGTLEAFLTDGLRTLTTTIKARSMSEKTLRYPGHAQAMRAFREAGFFSKQATVVCDQQVRPLDVTAALLFPRWTFGDEEADVTVLKVLVEGTERIQSAHLQLGADRPLRSGGAPAQHGAHHRVSRGDRRGAGGERGAAGRRPPAGDARARRSSRRRRRAARHARRALHRGNPLGERAGGWRVRGRISIRLKPDLTNVPEGDTIFRAARTLHRALAGRVVRRFESAYPALTRIDVDRSISGRTVDAVSSRGKHLLVSFSGGLVLRYSTCG